MSKINKIKVGSTVYEAGGASGGYATCTLTTTWTGTAPSLTQTVTSGTGDFSKITSNDNPVLDVAISASGQIDAENEAWSKVWKAETGDGQITFYASEATTTALTVAIKW